MTLLIRRIIALSFILTFLIAAPMLILYTAGYRYNFKKAQLQKTGVLVLATEPKGANVFLDNEDTGKTTPVRLNTILPDDYQVTVKKENFYPWTKKLTIKSQESTFAEDIVLFKKTEPEMITEQKTNQLDFSPTKKLAAYSLSDFSQDYLYVLNLNNGKTRLLYNGPAFGDYQIYWAQNDAWLLLQGKKNTIVLSTSLPGERKQITASKYPAAPGNFKWSQTDSNLLYFQSGNWLYAFDLSLNKVTSIFSLPSNETLMDYLVLGQNIFVISALDSKKILTSYSLATESSLKKSIELKNDRHRLIDIYQNLIGVSNLDSGDFYLINLSLDKILFHKNGVKNIDFSLKTNLLLLQTDQELSFLDLTKSELTEKNITRFSQGVCVGRWHSNQNYIFALQDGKVHVIELDDRNGHFIISLPPEGISEFGVDAKSKNLFYRQNELIWQLPLD